MPVILILLALAVSDVFTRLLPSPDRSYTKRVSVPVYLEPRLHLGESQHEAYLKKIHIYDLGRPELSPVLTESLAQEAPDHSLLRSNMITFRLLAIFKERENYAVLERFNDQSGAREVLEARVGDELEGYRVSRLSTKGVTFSRPGFSDVVLRLFEMSQRNGDER